jgi:hypothetical protein
LLQASKPCNQALARTTTLCWRQFFEQQIISYYSKPTNNKYTTTFAERQKGEVLPLFCTPSQAGDLLH